MKNKLSQLFKGIAIKRLSKVEISPDNSNQHELNGVSRFKELFGSEDKVFRGSYLYLNDDQESSESDEGMLTWYDARRNHETRTEYRLYYRTNNVMDTANEGDLLFVGMTDEESLLVVIAEAGSTPEAQLTYLFGSEEVQASFQLKDFTENDQEINFTEKMIIEKLGIEIPQLQSDYLEEMINNFGERFPSTKEFSEFARSKADFPDPKEDADQALLAILEQEEQLFRALERHLVSSRIIQGFGVNGDDVDEFVRFSLSVQNRRKSRAGHSFENQLSFVFEGSGIAFSRGKITERKNRPDFLFPGVDDYQDSTFPTNLLSMLGVKTTAKDRWRQVLSEADRIEKKHLITLEPSISRNQTEEMKAQQLQLVLPRPLLESYHEDQQEEIMSLSDFISFVKEHQQLLEG